jgi:hypothetical protein
MSTNPIYFINGIRLIIFLSGYQRYGFFISAFKAFSKRKEGT